MIRQERCNREMWLQGAYFYDALLCAAPVFHAFAKSGTKAHPYPSEPYQFGPKKASEKAKTSYDKGKQFMEMFMAAHNQRYERK